MLAFGTTFVNLILIGFKEQLCFLGSERGRHGHDRAAASEPETRWSVTRTFFCRWQFESQSNDSRGLK